MAGISKTNVARLLDKAKIAYELVPYIVDENNLAATHIAEQLKEYYYANELATKDNVKT